MVPIINCQFIAVNWPVNQSCGQVLCHLAKLSSLALVKLTKLNINVNWTDKNHIVCSVTPRFLRNVIYTKLRWTCTMLVGMINYGQALSLCISLVQTESRQCLGLQWRTKSSVWRGNLGATIPIEFYGQSLSSVMALTINFCMAKTHIWFTIYFEYKEWNIMEMFILTPL